jgi:hypothetical protein
MNFSARVDRLVPDEIKPSVAAARANGVDNATNCVCDVVASVGSVVNAIPSATRGATLKAGELIHQLRMVEQVDHHRGRLFWTARGRALDSISFRALKVAIHGRFVVYTTCVVVALERPLS